MAVNSWWNTSYPLRMGLSMETSLRSVTADHPIKVTLSNQYLTSGRIKSNFQDLEVLYYESSSWKVLGRQVTANSNGTFTIQFNTVTSFEDVSIDTYFLHYGNPGLKNQPTRPAYSGSNWPISINSAGLGLSYTKPGIEWVDGASSAKGATATFKFYGQSVRLRSKKHLGGGILEARIDDGSWSNVNLFAVDTLPDEVVYTQEGLSLGVHNLTLRVSGRKAASATSTEVNIKYLDFAQGYEVEKQPEETLPTLAWSSVFGGVSA